MEEQTIRAIVVGSGAGGATAARELARKNFEVLVLEAGNPFNPLTHRISWLSPFRGTLLLKNEHSIEHDISTPANYPIKRRFGNN